MKPRTTLWQIIRLAWLLYMNPDRKRQRILQMLLNCAATKDYYYTENEKLLKELSS